MTCRQFGFEHMLIDLMEAPPSVLTYFCTYHHLHNIPVADNMTVDQIAAFTSRHSNIQTFFTKDQIVSLSLFLNISLFLFSILLIKVNIELKVLQEVIN